MIPDHQYCSFFTTKDFARDSQHKVSRLLLQAEGQTWLTSTCWCELSQIPRLENSRAEEKRGKQVRLMRCVRCITFLSYIVGFDTQGKATSYV